MTFLRQCPSIVRVYDEKNTLVILHTVCSAQIDRMRINPI